MRMDLISIIVVLIVLGLVLWLVQTYLQLPPPIKTVITIVVVLFICVWLLQAVGVAHLSLR